MNTHTRSIKKGDQFQKLIPQPKNRKVFLGSGDTFLSLKNMKTVIFETLDETKRVASQLQGQSVAQSVKNIKDFIYWHIQYLQDEVNQELHSPSHTWSVRSKGVDCKSYSIFASSILTNLGIANNLRQIKQISYNPEYWTHVYVFIPEHNLVIDGTVKYDHEPQYAAKFDQPVLESGLKGLGQLNSYCNWDCNCTNNKTTTFNNNNSKDSNSQKGGAIARGGARLPFINLANLIAGINAEQSSDPVGNIRREHVPEALNNRLRLAKVKAKARKRKILLLKV